MALQRMQLFMLASLFSSHLSFTKNTDQTPPPAADHSSSSSSAVSQTVLYSLQTGLPLFTLPLPTTHLPSSTTPIVQAPPIGTTSHGVGTLYASGALTPATQPTTLPNYHNLEALGFGFVPGWGFNLQPPFHSLFIMGANPNSTYNPNPSQSGQIQPLQQQYTSQRVIENKIQTEVVNPCMNTLLWGGVLSIVSALAMDLSKPQTVVTVCSISTILTAAASARCAALTARYQIKNKNLHLAPLEDKLAIGAGIIIPLSLAAIFKSATNNAFKWSSITQMATPMARSTFGKATQSLTSLLKPCVQSTPSVLLPHVFKPCAKVAQYLAQLGLK